MLDIIEGFLRFQRDVFPTRVDLFKRLASAQNPSALFVTCSDSRVVPEIVTQREPGDIFVVRNAGNIVPSHSAQPGGVSATVEYAIAVLGVSDIVVLGHSDCGAMTAIAKSKDLSHLPAVAAWLTHADAAKLINESHQHADGSAHVACMVRENVIAQLANLKTHPSVALGLSKGALTLHGWVYDIETGSIVALDGTTNEFLSLADFPQTRATQPRSARSA